MTTPVSINRLLTTLKQHSILFPEILRCRLVGVSANAKSLVDTSPVFEENEKIDKNFQSIRDQIESVFNKRKAINEANQQVTITIKGRTFTVAEALLYKKHALPLYEQFIAQFDAQMSNARSVYKTQNQQFERIITESKPQDDAARESLAKMFQPVIYSQTDQIDEIRNFIREFKIELDGLLSEVNSTTLISVD